MKLFLPAIVLFALFFSPLFSLSQQIPSKTLLWRISGNGLQKPSYLYGTIHLKDRRLFFFGDSVYKSLETSEGFAMELDPNEMMDSVFSKMSEADTSSLLGKLLDKRKFKSVAKKLEKKFGMPADKITRKQIITERENSYYNIRKSDDMKSVVDMYLYNIAHKQGKWVGGIEDVNDQLGIKDELGKDINILEYIDDDNDDKRNEYLEKIITLYAAGDIEKIDQVFSGSQSQKTKDLVLVNRNIKMAGRMDSLAHIRNSFFAVGAAHLPGSTGLIRLLQNKKFSLTPVFSSKRIVPEKYTYTAKKIPWIKFSEPDSAYVVEMPGKPSDLKVAGSEVKLKIYADLVTNIVYMTGFSFFSTGETAEASMDRMIKSFLTKGFEKKEEKKIINKEVNGREVIAVRENIYYRLQIFPLADKVFITMAGGEKKESLYSYDVERFLHSFTMNANLAAKPNIWVNFNDSLKAFDISFPKKPAVDKLKMGETVKYIETTTYSALDIPNNTYYLVVVSDAKKGFIMSVDSIIFNDKMNYYKQNNSVISDVRTFKYEGNGAMNFSAQTSKDGLDYIVKILIICRGNRDYTIAAVTQLGKEDYPDISHFFNSFKLMPYKESAWANNHAHDNQFSTWSPSLIVRDLPDTAGLSGAALEDKLIEWGKRIQLLAYQPYSATTYNVNVYPVSKYYSAKNDSIFLASQLSNYYSDTSSNFAKENPGNFDSLIYKKAITNGKVNGIEILVKNGAKPYYKRIRILPHGDSAYHLFVLAPYVSITNENNNKFFEDFRFANEDLPSSIFKNKTGVILADLASIDSATKAQAGDAIGNMKFEATDLPALYHAYLKQYPFDSSANGTISEKISQLINKMHDSSTIAFVMNNYIVGDIHLAALKMNMLEMLAHQQSKPAVKAIKELLLIAPPSKGNPNSFIYQLSKNLLLSKDLFPEAARFFCDSLLGSGMLRIADELIDSNYLKREILLNNIEGILRTANAQLNQLKNDGDDYPVNNNYIINVLGKLNNKQSIGLLNGFLKINDLFIKRNAALALLKIKQIISPLEIHKIAAENGYRTDFYTALKEIGRQKLFSPEFYTQQQFAEGYLYSYTSEDEAAITTCKLLGERHAVIKGMQRRFYLFKVSFKYAGETVSHLAICGRFDMNRKKVELNADDLAIRIFYDEKFAAISINKLFKKFLSTEKNEDASAFDK